METSSQDRIFLSVVMPAFNEEASIRQVIADHVRALETLKDHLTGWEIVCLDDASGDHTAEILGELAGRFPNLVVLRHRENRGIAASFAELYRAARGTHIYATGSDGQWPAENLAPMFEALCGSGHQLVVGVRENRRQVYSRQRLAVSFIFNLLPRLLFGVRTRDAGSIKLGVREVFEFALISRSPFAEAERIIRSRKCGYRVGFVPIRFLPRQGGKARGAKWTYLAGSLRDVVKCFFHYNFRRMKTDERRD